MSNENKPDQTQQPAPPTPATPTGDEPKKKKLSLDIEEVDVSETLERKISA